MGYEASPDIELSGATVSAAKAVDTANNFMIVSFGDDAVGFMRPPKMKMTKEEALSLAAWLVALADHSHGGPKSRFGEILDAILDC